MIGKSTSKERSAAGRFPSPPPSSLYSNYLGTKVTRTDVTPPIGFLPDACLDRNAQRWVDVLHCAASTVCIVQQKTQSVACTRRRRRGIQLSCLGR